MGLNPRLEIPTNPFVSISDLSGDGLSGVPNWCQNVFGVLPWRPKIHVGGRWESHREPRRKSSDSNRELLENLRGGVELLDPVELRSPQPPESFSESLKPQFPTPSRAPDLGVGGFERAAPTAADPEKKKNFQQTPKTYWRPSPLLRTRRRKAMGRGFCGWCHK